MGCFELAASLETQLNPIPIPPPLPPPLQKKEKRLVWTRLTLKGQLLGSVVQFMSDSGPRLEEAVFFFFLYLD